MPKIAFILLCHKDPKAIIQQAERLTATGDCLSIHFDARADASAYAQMRDALRDNPNVVFARKRIKCGWGEWSLVQATLNAVESALDAFPDATHFYMLSGDCMAIKTSEYIHRFLDEQDADYIESFDYFKSDWIKTGIKEERLIYRHWFNERAQKWLFYKSLEMQERFNLRRDIPAGIQMQIGSQWWCLRRRSVEALLAFLRQRPDVKRFFKTTWIPDETFFQTLIRNVVPDEEIRTRTLTFLLFSDYGMPVVFYNDQYEMLLNQDYLFARKISPEALDLRERLGALYSQQDHDFVISNEAAKLYTFLSNRGRFGRRFTPRFWQRDTAFGRQRELLIVTCKKWHVAKRLLDKIREHTDIHAMSYIFDEDTEDLPPLGGIENSVVKRNRHRHALIRILFDSMDTNRLLICMDPSNLDLIQDLAKDRSVTRVLELQCSFTDDYLTGHASRVGLIGADTSPEVVERLLPAIRNEFIYESDQIRDSELDHHYEIAESSDEDYRAEQVARFLSVGTEQAQKIADIPHLFVD